MWSPRTSHQAAFLVVVGKANIHSLLASVLGHLSQLRCQVDSNVFIQGVVCDVCKVVQVVEAIQPLPLFGPSQQSIPVMQRTEVALSGVQPPQDRQWSRRGHMVGEWPFMPGTLLITDFI